MPISRSVDITISKEERLPEEAMQALVDSIVQCSVHFARNGNFDGHNTAVGPAISNAILDQAHNLGLGSDQGAEIGLAIVTTMQATLACINRLVPNFGELVLQSTKEIAATDDADVAQE